MAGDWIKVEHATIDKPEILRTAELLGISRDAALGLYFRFWVWLDKNLSGFCPDFVRHVSEKSLDDVLQCPGFSACLEAVGWAKFDHDGVVLQVSNADRHNGNTAKNRALDTKRKRAERRENVREMSGSKPDKTRTREEKRRDLTTYPHAQDARDVREEQSAPPGFAAFWSAYPNNSGRRKDKQKCLKLWKAQKLEPLAGEIIDHIEAMKRTTKWRRNADGESFEPATATYLRNRNWEDGLPDDARKRGVVV